MKTSPPVSSYKKQKEINFEEKNGRKHILASVCLVFREIHLKSSRVCMRKGAGKSLACQQNTNVRDCLKMYNLLGP